MSKVKFDTGIEMEHKNRYFRFVPTISTGHLTMAASVIVASTLAWAQLRSDIAKLDNENSNRKAEIQTVTDKQDKDRGELYRKITESQATMHGEIKDLGSTMAARFDRLEDKLDRKADKRP